MTDFFIETKPAKNCTEGHISEFLALVKQGDEVDAQGLRERVKASHLLTFARLDGILVGIAALKNPRENYRARVGDKANYIVSSSLFPYELGWVYIDVKQRRKKLSGRILKSLLDSEIRQGLFATSKKNNTAMHKTLMKNGFEQAGAPYPSSQRQDANIILFIRPKPKG